MGTTATFYNPGGCGVLPSSGGPFSARWTSETHVDRSEKETWSSSKQRDGDEVLNEAHALQNVRFSPKTVS